MLVTGILTTFVVLKTYMLILMNTSQQKEAARRFAAEWAGRGYEKGESQSFWLGLLAHVFGVEHPEQLITFEDKVMLDHASFIDGYIAETRVLIEQKGLDKDLRKPIRQSDGTLLTPYQQAVRYVSMLPLSRHPRWVVTCNFRSFLIYDMERPHAEPEEILLENLETEYYRLQFLVDKGNEHIRREMEVSLQAGDLVGRLYDLFLACYIDKTNPHSLRSLNMLCVRLVFCLYAEDAGLFGSRTAFHDYLAAEDVGNMRRALIDLFRVLDTPPEQRDPYLDDRLAAFPYVNGGLFADEDIEIPRFTPEIRQLLLQNASENFDWNHISPTIFGAVFESTLNPETRRSGGMHYTSIENIHKVIGPLFLDDLEAELQALEQEKVERTRRRGLLALQEKMASLTFLDPACGSGNFLTETYLCLRRLENRIISLLYSGQAMLGDFLNPIRVHIGQFYGIEINDFAVAVARTALWIAEAQMMEETERIVSMSFDFLPLHSYPNLAEGNALRMDWLEVMGGRKPDYIMGNPPFVGARVMSAEQKEDMLLVFGDRWKNVGNMDYVCGWYMKAVDLMAGTQTRAALVSTNSITQGEQVANIWKPLMEERGVHIDFAYRTFRWDSEANLKAQVHCVIVGFSLAPFKGLKRLFAEAGGTERKVEHINAYLLDALDVFVESRKQPLCLVPEIGIGNKPIDGGYYLFTAEERDEFIRQEPRSAAYFRPWYGAQEFINRSPRYCLWLGNCSPAELRAMPRCLERVEAVRALRLASKSAGTVKLADKPTRFHVENMPEGNYLLIPRHSSENRSYIPIGFMSPDDISSDAVQIIPNATLYHFGILTSNVHMAWMRAFAGRLKSDYRYSKEIVYNNFPWPEATDKQQQKITQTAQAILDARAIYADSSLADLYAETTMPSELRKAHQQNDRAVMEAYGFSVADTTESVCVAKLMELYTELVNRQG